ncbi:MAG: gliding motility-associated ABC transporter substrate-binding protein GldG [Bacteroidia bacterium]|nr:MAG: gliding motility-associated ABC transporter substrate-binding protein GldG [Bacteroidia bacterium]
MNNSTTQYSSRKKDIFQFVSIVFILVILNFIFRFYFFRLDLTSEKRYTLSAFTKEYLKKIDDIVFFKIYLSGDLPPEFNKLKNEVKEMLDEMRIFNDNIQYEFIDINEIGNKEDIRNLEKQLYEKGIVPEQVVEKKENKTSESLIWPGALVSYKGKETVWQIFSRQLGFTPQENINHALNEIEYGICKTIHKLQRKKRPEISIVEGHKELDTLQLYDLIRSLGEEYNISRIKINHKLYALKDLDAIIIAKPDTFIDEKDKFIIDQFIMKGGKVLWLVDAVKLNMDSFRLKGFTLALNNETNLEDMLFRYGVRVNADLIQDLQCAAIPVNIGFSKGQPNFKLFPWIFFPLIMPTSTHPIVKNLDLIKTEFISTIDTLSTSGIKKTILLTSSKNSRVTPVPFRVSLAITQFKLKESAFNQGPKPIAVLLEGTFKSLYANRIPTVIMEDSSIQFKEISVPNKMIVVSDGDIARNDFNRMNGMIYPLGYDKYTNQTFANKKFLVNCMNYLLDDEGLLQLRSREVKLRLLDIKKVALQKNKWQMYNVLLPPIIILIFAVIQYYTRRKKYAT